MKSPKEIREAATHTRRLSLLTVLMVVLAAIASIAMIYAVVTAIGNNRELAKSQQTIEVVRDDNPCSVLYGLRNREMAPGDKALRKSCRGFLSSLTQDQVFPQRLACYIARNAGVANASKCKFAQRSADRAKRSGAGGRARDGRSPPATTPGTAGPPAPSPPATQPPPPSPGPPSGGGDKTPGGPDVPGQGHGPPAGAGPPGGPGGLQSLLCPLLGPDLCELIPVLPRQFAPNPFRRRQALV